MTIDAHKQPRARSNPPAERAAWKERQVPVTVCIAALSNGGQAVVCASDRMLTLGTYEEYEPEHSKAWRITDSIGLLVAGDYALQSSIYERLREDIEGLATVRDAADRYLKHFVELRQEDAERSVLSIYGLDFSAYTKQQHALDPTTASRIADQLEDHQFPYPAALIVGFDGTGRAHIYQATGTRLQCCDAIGHAAIGIGATPAISQLAFSGHTRHTEFIDTVWMTYLAKKRAESVAGVGEHTDLLTFYGPGKHHSDSTGGMLKVLKQLYEDVQARERAALQDAADKMKGLFSELTQILEQQDKKAPGHES